MYIDTLLPCLAKLFLPTWKGECSYYNSLYHFRPRSNVIQFQCTSNGTIKSQLNRANCLISLRQSFLPQLIGAKWTCFLCALIQLAYIHRALLLRVWPVNQQHHHPWKLSKNTNCQLLFRLNDSEPAVSQVTWMHVQFWASLCQNTYQPAVLHNWLNTAVFPLVNSWERESCLILPYIQWFTSSSFNSPPRSPVLHIFATRTLLAESNLTNLLR